MSSTAQQEVNEEARVIGYCRVSTAKQDLRRQRHSILEYANGHGWIVDRFISTKVSTRKSDRERGLDKLREAVAEEGVDVIVFSELSRMARSVGQITRLVKEFTEKGVALHFIKEGLALNNGHRDITSKVTLTMFSLLAEIERDLISERTKDALAARRAQGVRLGRPPGKSKLDPHEDYIFERLDMGVTQRRIAEDVGCTEATLSTWLKRKREERMAVGATDGEG